MLSSINIAMLYTTIHADMSTMYLHTTGLNDIRAVPQAYLRAASSSSCGLLVAPMTNILSFGSATTWKSQQPVISFETSLSRLETMSFGIRELWAFQNRWLSRVLKRDFRYLRPLFRVSRQVFQDSRPVFWNSRRVFRDWRWLFVEFWNGTFDTRDESFSIRDESFNFPETVLRQIFEKMNEIQFGV